MPIDLDAHASPPKVLREIFKTFKGSEIHEAEPEVKLVSSDSIDFLKRSGQIVEISTIPEGQISNASSVLGVSSSASEQIVARPVFTFKALPGLRWMPSLIPPSAQRALLDRLLHRDLSSPQHKTNCHLHYEIQYPSSASHHTAGQTGQNGEHSSSFFSLPPSQKADFEPKDPATHTAITLTQFLSKKLRWCTLGSQYDWTAKAYPSKESSPGFPDDIKGFVQTFFADMEPEAAIVNLYSPGDTLGLHRDVSEECDKPLVSISLGCECVFIIGREIEGQVASSLALKLRSGDALYMSEDSRFAWHGVPKIIKGTCPKYLSDWPDRISALNDSASTGSYWAWKGWMDNRRINLNVRQMYD